MTIHKHLKARVRDRMRKTSESYITARRHIVGRASRPPGDPAARWHFPGNVPAATALRVLLAHASVRAPHTGEPFSEAMVFGIAGGVGIGVFTFLYEKEDFASFFVAGRHLWHDDLAYFGNACRRLGLKPVVSESGSVKPADQQLREALAAGPCIAWVDMAHLPHRALPAYYSGGGYHVVTIYRADEETALIGDLTDDPIPIPLTDLATARARIKKQKHRLFTLPPASGPRDLAALVWDGLRACHDGLDGSGAPKNARTNFSLEALRLWAERLHGSKDKERWERVFAPPRLWRGLLSIHDFIEHYGTGGGLCRPLFAEFLAEAADALGDPRLRSLSQQYADLGRAWGELAEAALPDAVPLFREVRELHGRKAELLAGGGPADEARAVWEHLDGLEKQARADFPLSATACADLRARLQARVRALYDAEKAAHAALGEVLP